MNTRNLALENIANKVKYPCTNRKFGCKEVHSVDFIREHQAVCPYALYTCPFIKEKKCPWADIQSRLKEHLLECHSRDITEQDGVTNVVINTDSTQLNGCKVMFAYDEIFYIHIYRMMNDYYIVVRYVGGPKNASKYGYKISFKKFNSIESITVCHATRSVQDELGEIFQSGNCFKLPYDLLKRFETYEANLPYNLEIFKVDE
jgi:hypothetical protein